jgi:hypothetical protein
MTQWKVNTLQQTDEHTCRIHGNEKYIVIDLPDERMLTLHVYDVRCFKCNELIHRDYIPSAIDMKKLAQSNNMLYIQITDNDKMDMVLPKYDRDNCKKIFIKLKDEDDKIKYLRNEYIRGRDLEGQMRKEWVDSIDDPYAYKYHDFY